MSDPVTQIAVAISEGFKLVANILAGSDMRRIRKAIDSGEKYILTSEDPSIRADVKYKLLKKYREAFFEHN